MSAIESAVADRIISRGEIGRMKYGITMERDDLATVKWLIHLQEELMDAAMYVEKLIRLEKGAQ